MHKNVVSLKRKLKLHVFPKDKNSNRRKVLIHKFHKEFLKMIHKKAKLICESQFVDCYFKPCNLGFCSRIQQHLHLLNTSHIYLSF